MCAHLEISVDFLCYVISCSINVLYTDFQLESNQVESTTVCVAGNFLI